MRFATAALILLGCGCGRLGFDSATDATPPGSDAPADTPAFTCPATYTQLSTGCFRLDTNPVLAADAEAACEADGGHLAVIDSQAENDALVVLEGTTSSWIGFVKSGPSFVAITTNAIPTFDHWAPGDPNGEGNCVRLLEATGDWDDEPCSKVLRFLCEIDGLAPIVSVPN